MIYRRQRDLGLAYNKMSRLVDMAIRLFGSFSIGTTLGLPSAAPKRSADRGSEALLSVADPRPALVGKGNPKLIVKACCRSGEASVVTTRSSSATPQAIGKEDGGDGRDARLWFASPKVNACWEDLTIAEPPAGSAKS